MFKSTDVYFKKTQKAKAIGYTYMVWIPCLYFVINVIWCFRTRMQGVNLPGGIQLCREPEDYRGHCFWDIIKEKDTAKFWI